MKVVLNQDIKGIGKKLQVLEVSEGYARNYLLPRKLASVASNKNVNEATTKVESQKFKKNVELEAAENIKKDLEKKHIEFRLKLGNNGKLFGSVTEKEIADNINLKYNFNIDKKKIIIKNPIKQIGNYTVQIKIYEGVVANLKIVVVGM